MKHIFFYVESQNNYKRLNTFCIKAKLSADNLSHLVRLSSAVTAECFPNTMWADLYCSWSWWLATNETYVTMCCTHQIYAVKYNDKNLKWCCMQMSQCWVWLYARWYSTLKLSFAGIIYMGYRFLFRNLSIKTYILLFCRQPVYRSDFFFFYF